MVFLLIVGSDATTNKENKNSPAGPIRKTEKMKITSTSLAAAIRVSTTAAATSVSAPLTAATSIAATKQKAEKNPQNYEKTNK
jgi:hypothetical protein